MINLETQQNTTTNVHVTLAGSLNKDMGCKGSQYVDGENEYNGVFVRDYLNVYHKSYTTNVDIKLKTVLFF